MIHLLFSAKALRRFILQGDTEGAEKLVQMAEPLLGIAQENTHPVVALAMASIAEGHMIAGRPAEAERLFVRSLGLMEQNPDIGPVHPVYAWAERLVGRLLRDSGSFDQAERRFLHARSVLDAASMQTTTDYAQVLSGLGGVYRMTGRYREAGPLLQGALRIDRELLGEEHRAVAIHRSNLGWLCLDTGRYDEAEEFFRAAARSWEETESSESTPPWPLLNGWALALSRQGQHQEAERIFSRSLEKVRRRNTKGDPEVAFALNNFGVFLCEQGRWTEAGHLLREAESVRRKDPGKGHPLYKETVLNLIWLELLQGHSDASHDWFRQLIALGPNREGGKVLEYIQAAVRIGELYRQRGHYSAALALMRWVVQEEKCHRKLDCLSRARHLKLLADMYRDVQDLNESAAAADEAAELFLDAVGDGHPELLQCRVLQASNSYRQGDRDKAESLNRSLLASCLVAFGPDHPFTASVMCNLGNNLREAGNLDEARPLLERAQDILRGSGEEHRQHLSAALNNLALLRQAEGDHEGASTLFQEMAELLGDLPEAHPSRAFGFINLAHHHIKFGRADGAFDALTRAIDAEDRLAEHALAVASEHQRLAFLEEQRATFFLFVALVADHFPESVHAVEAACTLTLKRKAAALDLSLSQREAAFSGANAELRSEYEGLLAQRWRVGWLSRREPGEGRGNDHLAELKSEIDILSRMEAKFSTNVPALALARRLKATDWKSVAGALPEGSALIEYVALQSPLHTVPGATLVLRQLLGGRYVAFVLLGGPEPALKLCDLGDMRTIDQAIDSFRRAIVPAEPDNQLASSADAVEELAALREAGARVRELLFDPCVPYLDGRRRLFIAPDGATCLLPFEVLPTSGNDYFVDEYTTTYLATGRDLLREPGTACGHAGDALIIASPDFDAKEPGHWPVPPPSTAPLMSGGEPSEQAGCLSFERRESLLAQGHGVAAILQKCLKGLTVHLWTEGDATKGRLRSCRAPWILHFATHGYFLDGQDLALVSALHALDLLDGLPLPQAGEEGFKSVPDDVTKDPLLMATMSNPLLRSGLALAGANTYLQSGRVPADADDGLLTAEDVIGLDLTGTELVVLSACDTGLGDARIGEGVFGLRYAFAVAGARSLVMSLWKVPDEETSRFMFCLYRKLLVSEGKNRAEAIREAQLIMRREYVHPYFWGGFVFQGASGPLYRVPTPVG